MRWNRRLRPCGSSGIAAGPILWLLLCGCHQAAPLAASVSPAADAPASPAEAAAPRLAPPAAAELPAAASEEPAPRRPAVELAAAFEFPADAGGKVLAESLLPPRQLPLPPVAFQDAPQSWAAPRSEVRVHGSLWPLFEADKLAAARLTDADTGVPHILRPATDLPPLGLAAEPPLPAPVWLPVGSLIGSYSPPAEVPPTPPFSDVNRGPRPAVTDDPGVERSRAATLPPASITRAAAPPLLTLAPPDPRAAEQAIRLHKPPVDADPPSAPPGPPGRPVLPEPPPVPAAEN